MDLDHSRLGARRRRRGRRMSQRDTGRTRSSDAPGRRLKRAVLSDVTSARVCSNGRHRNGVEVFVRSAADPRENRRVLVRSDDSSAQGFIAPKKLQNLPRNRSVKKVSLGTTTERLKNGKFNILSSV